MPYLKKEDIQIYYEEYGSGEETIIFSHSLLCSHRSFKRQTAYFKEKYRCIMFDFRGQGMSSTPDNGYDMDTLTADVVYLINALKCQPCHFVGVSMGGFVGLRLAIRKPALLKSLTLLDSTFEKEDPKNLPKYKLLLRVAHIFGLGAVAGRVFPIMFGSQFLNNPVNKKELRQWKKDLINSDKKGVLNAVKGVIYRDGLAPELLQNISTPTLIVVGSDDKATPEIKSQKLHQLIPDSKLKIINGGGHLTNMEKPEEVNRILEVFLDANGSG
jgi:pimeloyl-ACP methyl ester carboxylesterase